MLRRFPPGGLDINTGEWAAKKCSVGGEGKLFRGEVKKGMTMLTIPQA